MARLLIVLGAGRRGGRCGARFGHRSRRRGPADGQSGRGHAPCHRLGPCQCGVDGGQQCAIPVIFQDTPAPFDEIVFAVIGRVVRQFQRELMPVRELDQAFHELSPGTGDLRAVVQIDQQPTHARMRKLAVGPPQFQAIRHEVARVPARCRRRCSVDCCQLPKSRPVPAERRDACHGQQRATDSSPRATPPRENAPIFTLALVSSEMRSVSEVSAARVWTCFKWSKMASVSGFFFEAWFYGPAPAGSPRQFQDVMHGAFGRHMPILPFRIGLQLLMHCLGCHPRIRQRRLNLGSAWLAGSTNA